MREPVRDRLDDDGRALAHAQRARGRDRLAHRERVVAVDAERVRAMRERMGGGTPAQSGGARRGSALD